MVVCYTPPHNHIITNTITFMRHVDMRTHGFIMGINEAVADPTRYGPSTSIWIVPGTYRGE